MTHEERFAEISKRVAILEKMLNTPTDIEIICNMVAKRFNVRPEMLESESRRRKFVEPRQIVMYLAALNTKLTKNKIGAYFYRDHSTVIHAIKTVQDLMQTDENYRNIVNELQAEI